MTHFIDNLVEPTRLLLVWQSPDLQGDRARRVVGELQCSAVGSVVLRYLQGTEDFEEACRHGFTGYPAFPLSKSEYRSNVLETFLRRLPPPSRTDYARYLERLGLRPGAALSDFAMLGYSGAALPSDEFSIVNPFDEAPAPCEFMTEAAGVRHYWPPARPLAPGDRVDLTAEPENPRDSQAIRLSVDGQTIGYINRAQTTPFHEWLSRNPVEVFVTRVNGNRDRPHIVLFVRVSSPRKAAA